MQKIDNDPNQTLAGIINKYYLTRVSFDVPDKLATNQMSLWLLEVWESSLIADASVDLLEAEATKVSPVLESWLQGFLILSQRLFGLAAMPLFDLPMVKKISLDHGDRRFLVDLATPVIDGVDSVIYRDIYRISIQLCLWMSKHPDTPENREWLFAYVSRHVIAHFKKIVPAGKSTIPVLRAAHASGIPFQHLGLGIYQLGWGNRARRLDRSATERDSAQGARLCHNKTSAIRLMAQAGLPVPRHTVVATIDQALRCVKDMGFPLVIKPMALERGEGVHVDVSEESEVAHAVNEVKKLTPRHPVVVEKQVSGVCHRLFIVQGQLLYAVKRDPVSVFGDGKSTVSELVRLEVRREEVRPPWLRYKIVSLDAMALAELKRCGLDEDVIPQFGQKVSLRRLESTANGGVDEDVTALIHPENVKIALRAARLFDLEVAGIDLISQDISVPWYENGAVINEVNFAPLLGGAAISRSYLPRFFEQLMPDRGLIPIRLFQGEDKNAEALKERDTFLAQGIACYWLDDVGLYDPAGEKIQSTATSLSDRCRVALLNRDVAALVIWSASLRH